MEVIFINKDLEQVYKTGFSKKYKKVPLEVIRKFPRAVDVLRQCKIITDIWHLPAYRFERLQGYSSRYSMRLNRTWRLEMEIEWKDDSCTIGVISLDDITAHYGD